MYARPKKCNEYTILKQRARSPLKMYKKKQFNRQYNTTNMFQKLLQQEVLNMGPRGPRGLGPGVPGAPGDLGP